MITWIKGAWRANINIRAWVIVVGLALVPYTVHAIAVSALSSLTGANSALGDLFVVVDISEAAAGDRTKNITRDELAVGLALATSNLVVVAEIDTESELETVSNITNILRETEIDASSELLAIMDDETGTGLLVFGTEPVFTTTIQLPASDTPTVDANGEIALDTDVTGHTDFLIFRGGDAAEDKLIIAIPRDQLNTTDGHVIAYNATDDEFEMVAASAGSGDITDVFECATGDCASITIAATDLLNMSGSDASTTTEGLILPQHATACAGGTAEGQVCWEADQNALFIGNGATLTEVGTGGGHASITDNGNTEAMLISADEEITLPLQPCFLAYNSVVDSNKTGQSATYTLDFDTEVFDRGSNFASDTFTAPVTGLYLLTTTVNVSGITTAADTGLIQIVTTARSYRGTQMNDAGNYHTVMSWQVTTVADMSATDTATVTIAGTGESSEVWDIAANAGNMITRFSGCLLA